MAKLEWNVELDEILVCDKSLTAAIKLSKKDGIVFLVGNKEYYIDPQKIHHVALVEPKLFREGIVGIFVDENEYFVTEDGRPALIGFGKKQKYGYYFMVGIFSENGIRIKLG